MGQARRLARHKNRELAKRIRYLQANGLLKKPVPKKTLMQRLKDFFRMQPRREVRP